MNGGQVSLAVGVRLAYDGQVWEVRELSVPGVLLASPTGAVRQVDVGFLLAHPSTRLAEAAEAVEGVGAPLGGLSESERAELAARIGHVQEVRTGFRRGCDALALPGEPRAAYAPGTAKLARYEAKAAELDVGVSTVRRWVHAFEAEGPAGLVDDRRHRAKAALGRADTRWVDTARAVLAEHTRVSTPTQDLIVATIAARLDRDYGPGVVRLPGRTRARALLREISRGSGAFGGAKGRREIAGRPVAPYGKLRAHRPGEYLLVDTTRLDVFAMERVTLRWVQAELTVAMDLYDRCITGLRLTPVSTKAVDAAAVLFESVRPLPEPAAGWVDVRGPYHGVPGRVVVDVERLVDAAGAPLLPSVAAETLVVDHGRIYLSEHLLSVCQRLGISVQPARVAQATDKAAVERFFRTLRQQLLVALPGYKGPDVHHRGADVEKQAFYFLDELEDLIRQWVADCYHRQPHAGLAVPEIPGLAVSPLEMFAHGVARAGHLQVPARADLVFDFLAVEWRTIQHYGVEVGGLRYDGPGLSPYRNRSSPHTGVHAGKWPIRVDAGDVSRVYFQDPADQRWHVLRWEHADALDAPFSADALAYARQLAAATDRFPDTRRALARLLERWDAGLAGNRAERRMAVRLSERRLRLVPETSEPAPPAVVPCDGDRPVEEIAGDDDHDDELAAPFPGDDDFYADAMEIV